MIDRKLAKELEVIGFWRKCFPNKHPLTGDKLNKKQRINVVSLTTLSELIDACGDFYGLFQEKKSQWSAHSQSMNKKMPGIAAYIGNGKTPEEAVARLYIALNKK